MQIGELRDRVTIQRVTQGRDSYGSVTESWSDAVTVYANVKPLKYATGLESVTSTQGREVTSPSYVVTIRFRTDVTVEDRLSWNGNTLDIRRAADPNGRRQWLELFCEVEEV